MSVPESVVASVVQETSERMRDPQFTQLTVGHFVESQRELARFLTARASRIGGAQGVMEAAFHAERLSECLVRHSGKAARPVDLRTLDRASQGDPVAAFSACEPALASYVASNVDGEPLRRELCRLGLALALTFG